MTAKRRWDWSFIEMLAAVALALALTRAPARVLYSLAAETESVTLTITSRSDWRLRAAHLTVGGEPEPRFTGIVRPRPGVTVVIRRVGTGKLRIRLEDRAADASPNGRVLAELWNDRDQLDRSPEHPNGELVGSTATFSVKAPDREDRALTLAVVGNLERADGTNAGSYGAVPMLRSGTVAMSAWTLAGFGTDRYFVARRELNAGDEFWLVDPAGGEGFVRVDERPAMTLVYWAAGTAGNVSGFGRTYELRTSAWERLRSDPALQLIWSIAGAFVLRLIAGVGRGRALVQTGLALGLLAATAVPAVADVFVVHVQSDADQRGVGMPRWWDGHCYVITPAHVVGDASGPVRLVGTHRRQALGKSQWSSEGNDLAILRVTSGEDGACPDRSWTPTGSLDDLFAHATQGILKSLSDDGSERRTPVVLSKVQETHIDVAPAIAGAEIMQGQSGSVLEGTGRRAGLLLRVTEAGRGRVLREDYLEALVAPFFKLTWPTSGGTVCLRHDAATATLVEPFADAIRAAGAKPVAACSRRPAGSDMLSLTGTETTDVLEDNWIVNVHGTVVVERADGEESHRQLRVRGASTLDAKRARAGLADDLREQIKKANDLAMFVGIKADDDERIGEGHR